MAPRGHYQFFNCTVFSLFYLMLFTFLSPVDINLVYDTLAVKKIKIPTDTKPAIEPEPTPAFKVESVSRPLKL